MARNGPAAGGKTRTVVLLLCLVAAFFVGIIVRRSLWH
jgi:hypothetical protein